MSTRIHVAQASEISAGSAKAVDLPGGERVAVFNVDGQFYAMTDACPHAGGPLSDGWVDGTAVTCPWHGWSFDLCPDDTPNDGVCRYPVHVEGDDLYLEV